MIPNPYTNLPIEVADWRQSQVDVIDAAGGHRVLPNVMAWIDSLTAPHVLVIENSFESFVPGRRDACIAYAAANGHTMLGFNPRFTEKYRREVEMRLKTTDEADARTIFDVAVTSDLALSLLHTVDPVWAAHRAKIARSFNVMKFDQSKLPVLMPLLKKVIGTPSKVTDPVIRDVFINPKSKGFRMEGVMATAFFVAAVTDSRREFERLFGLYGNAYGSVFRAEFFHNGVGNFAYEKVKGESSVKVGEIQPLTRAVRHIRSAVKAAGITADSLPAGILI